MIRRPPRSTRTDTLFPYTTLFRSLPDTNETVISGLSDLHLRVNLDRLKERYGVDVTTRPPRIAYRETVAAKAEGHHRHKKQTGGAGQFGEVFLRIEPLPRGGGFEFVDQVSSAEHTSELPSLMRISYDVFCLKKKS